MNYIIVTYVSYLLITISITIWVAKTLFKNGRVFLNEIFHGNLELSAAVNNLLLVGFYLINIGYTVYTLQIFREVLSAREMIEILSVKTGTIVLILGFMHFLNMFIFFKLRKKAVQENFQRQHAINLGNR